MNSNTNPNPNPNPNRKTKLIFGISDLKIGL